MCVVRNNTEPDIRGVFLHDATEGVLGGGRHGIGFVENDKFVGCEGTVGVGGCVEDLLCGGEGLDLFADYVDAPVIGGVELEDLLPVGGRAVDFARKGEDGRGFAGAGGAVEEEVGKALGEWLARASSLRLPV